MLVQCNWVRKVWVLVSPQHSDLPDLGLCLGLFLQVRLLWVRMNSILWLCIILLQRPDDLIKAHSRMTTHPDI